MALGFACLAAAQLTLAGAALAGDGSAVWALLSGPVDPQPTWDARAIHDPVRHEMLIVDGLNPGVMWILSLPTSGSPQWRHVPIGGPTPPPRWNASAVLDSLRDRVILFGGTTPYGHSCDDTWAITLGDAPQWTELMPAGQSPSPRESHVAIMDPVRDRMLVFGGYDRDSSAALDDTWTLTLGGTPAWVPMAPAGTIPGPRDAVAAVYDPWSDRMVMFGCDNTTWALALGGTPTWDSLGITSARPPARLAPAAILDRAGRRMVMHGGSLPDAWGTMMSDTWALQLDGPPAWALLPTTGESLSVMQQAAIYSPERGALIEFGGNTYDHANACHELDLGTLAWSRIQPSAPEAFPSRRGGSFMTMDAPTRRLFVYGGDFGGCLGDLWSFDRGDRAGWALVSMNGSVPDCSSFWSSFGWWRLVEDTRRKRLIAVHGDAWWGRTMNRVLAMPLDGSAGWSELVHTGPEPLGRYYSSLVYDPVRDRVLMFGGVVYGSRSNDSGDAQDDLWALSLGDTVTWTQLHPSGTPGRRDSHSAGYDARRDRMVVFGGESQFAVSLGNTAHPLFDTWALSLAGDSLTWSELSTTAPFDAPAEVDSLHDRLVAWPGDSTLWALPLSGNAAWRRLPASGDLPTPRTDFGVTFDTPRDRLLVFGGMLAEAGVVWPQVATCDLYELRFTDPTSVVAACEQSAYDRVSLTWSGIDPGGAVSVSRTRNDTAWVSVASLAADLSGRLSFTDRGIEPGRHYGYALTYADGTQRFGEIRVTVPAAPAFALRGFQPNPARAPVSVAFTLASAAPVRVQLLDVGGRRVVDRALTGLAPGPHVVSLDEAHALPPGLYFVRLTCGGQTRTARGVMIP